MEAHVQPADGREPYRASSRSKRTSRAPSPSTAWNTNSESFVFRESHADVVESKQVAVLGDDLARELNRGLLGATDPEQYAEQLCARECLGPIGEQPLPWPELGRELLDGIPSPHEVIVLSERASTSLLRKPVTSSP